MVSFGCDKSNEHVVSRPKATFHPEDRVRWLASDKYREAKNPEIDESQDDRPNERQRGSDSDAASQVSDTSTISTEVSVDKPVDFGEYTVGMPKLRNIYTWEHFLTGQSDHVDTLAKTQNFLRCLAYRLGATLREMRKKHRANRRHLTKPNKLQNRDFVRDITNYWIWDAENLPNDSHHNKNYIEYERVTPRYKDVVQMADPETYRNGGGWESITQNIIREVYANKDMLHPTRVMPFKGADGKTRDVTSREPVWTFAHPDHRPKARQFWDINRWPLHLQSKETEKAIRSSGPQPPSVVTGTQRSPRPETPPGSSSPPETPPVRPEKAVQPSDPQPPSAVSGTQRSPRQDIRPGVWSSHYPKFKTGPERPAVQSHTLLGELPREITTRHSNPEKATQSSGLQPPSVESMAQPQRTQRSPHPAFRPGALPRRSNVEAPPEIPTVQSRSLPAEFSREIAIPYSDPDVGRRGFKVGVPQFWAGDTPLQRKVMEETARECKLNHDDNTKYMLTGIFQSLNHCRKLDGHCSQCSAAVGSRTTPPLCRKSIHGSSRRASHGTQLRSPNLQGNLQGKVPMTLKRSLRKTLEKKLNTHLMSPRGGMTRRTCTMSLLRDHALLRPHLRLLMRLRLL